MGTLYVIFRGASTINNVTKSVPIFIYGYAFGNIIYSRSMGTLLVTIFIVEV